MNSTVTNQTTDSTPAPMTLTSALTEIMKSIGATEHGHFIFPLNAAVASNSAGLKEYEYTIKYKKKTAFYKFVSVSYGKAYGSAGWKFNFQLTCFPDGGQPSNYFDAITLLNYCTPADLLSALESRVAVL